MTPTCPDCGAGYVVLAVTIETGHDLTRIWACKACGKSFTVFPQSWWHLPLAITVVAGVVAVAWRYRSRARGKGSDLARALPAIL